VHRLLAESQRGAPHAPTGRTRPTAAKLVTANRSPTSLRADKPECSEFSHALDREEVLLPCRGYRPAIGLDRSRQATAARIPSPTKSLVLPKAPKTTLNGARCGIAKREWSMSRVREGQTQMGKKYGQWHGFNEMFVLNLVRDVIGESLGY
jgi:hypothetical protein